MKQYCRYCASLIVGDANYCRKKDKTMSDGAAKAPNGCKDFDFNEMDAFGETAGYKPREPKKPIQDDVSQFQILMEGI